ncbi:MAG: nucleotidyltransferase domain-containing protein [Candidatus Micrarchaeota archaeon]
MLNALFTSKTKRKILSLLFMNPKKSFYLREICRKVGEPTNAVSAELSKLEKANILTSRRAGNMLYCQTNAHCPIYSELKAIIAKTSGLGDAIRGALGKSHNLKFAFIYGSFAKGDERPSSDIDVMLIGKISPESILKEFKKLEKTCGREINYAIYPEVEFLKSLKKGFIQDVLKSKKIMLIGEENELKRFAKRWAD